MVEPRLDVEVAALREGTAYLVLVAHPSTTQRIDGIHELSTPAGILDHEPARDEMRAVIDGWPIPHVAPPTHATVLVVVRPGL